MRCLYINIVKNSRVDLHDYRFEYGTLLFLVCVKEFYNVIIKFLVDRCKLCGNFHKL